MDPKATIKSFSNIGDISEISHLIEIRLQVFNKEQGFSADLEIDEHDIGATHIELDYEGNPVGTARIFVEHGKLVMGRFMILKEFRALGLGRLLMDGVVTEAKKTDFAELFFHAQIQAVPFYSKCGAEVRGETEIIEDYPHVLMAYKL